MEIREEARADVLVTFSHDQALQAREAIRGQVLSEIGAEVHPERLTAPPGRR